MTIIFGSEEANKIRQNDLDKVNNTLELFTEDLFEDMIYIEVESESFSFDKIIDYLELFEDIEEATKKAKEDNDLYVEIMQDAQYFIKSLRDVVNKIENWQK